MGELIFDLFGNVVVARREGPGRPAHVWSVENSHKINLLFACNRSPLEVAQAIGISRPTLYKVYFSEVSARKAAALKLRGHQLFRLNREAEGGNVAAEKALAALVQAEQLRAASDRLSASPKPEKVATTPIGKKAQAAADAHQVTGLYEPPPESVPTLLN